MAKLAQKKVKKVPAKAKKTAARRPAKTKKPVARAKVAKKVAKAKKPVARAKVAKKVAKAKKPVARAKVAKRVAKAKAPKKVAKTKITLKAKAPKKVAKTKAAVAQPKRGVKAVRRHPQPAQRGPGVRRSDDGSAFLPDPSERGGRRVKDDLAEELGEEFVAGATGEATVDSRDAPATEEDGGPFITTSAESQYAPGTDESNPEDALREPFPRTHGGP